MIFGNINEQIDIFAVTFEITIGNMVQRKSIQAPRIFLEQEFLGLAQDAARSRDPVKISMKRKEPIWDSIDKRMIERENDITIKNQAYLNMERQWEK